MAVSTTSRPPAQREGLNWMQDGVRIAGARGPSVGGEGAGTLVRRTGQGGAEGG
jgi:hypothetical protein